MHFKFLNMSQPSILIIDHLRIFVIVSTVILKNGPVDSVAKLVVEVDGDLVAHPEKLY